MKTITPQLLKFILIALIAAIFFRYFLSLFIENGQGWLIIITAAVYAMLLFVAGWFLGKYEGQQLPIEDYGFRWHLATFLTHNIVSVGWFLMGLNTSKEAATVIYVTAAIWFCFILIHYFFYRKAAKNNIEGLDHMDIFE